MDNEKKKWMVVTTVVAVVSLLVGGIVTLLFRPAVSGSSIVELPADGSPAAHAARRRFPIRRPVPPARR